MTISELEKVVNNLVSQGDATQAEIIQKLADYAQLKFGGGSTSQQRALVDSVKEKLLLGYYELSGHRLVTKRPDFRKQFGLDSAEMNVL